MQTNANAKTIKDVMNKMKFSYSKKLTTITVKLFLIHDIFAEDMYLLKYAYTEN